MSSRENEVVINNEESVSDNEEIYTVEKVVGKRTRNNKTEYCLKWHGYSISENTWEPEEHLDCGDLIIEYEENLKLQKEQEKKKKEKELQERRKSRKASNSTVTSYGPSEAGPSCTSYVRRPISLPQPKIKMEKTDESENTNSTEINVENNMFEETENDDSEMTKNGYEPEKIIGATDAGGQLAFLFKWKGVDEADLILAEHANIMYPQIVIKFYQDRLKWETE